MEYGIGNYEAFFDKGVTDDRNKKKSAHLIGGGLASLSAAIFMVRDAKMSGENIHIYEELPIPGGSLDGINRSEAGFVVRGGREMENHFECLWDLFRSVPSLEKEGYSVLDEFYELNQKDPNSSKCRLIEKRGQRKKDDGKFTLTKQALKEIMELTMTPESQLDDVRIDQVFSEEFFNSNFWWYWSTMFAFEKWHSAMEMRRYLMRFVHHVSGLPDLSALKFTKYNQYESLVLPMIAYLEAAGVKFHYNSEIVDVLGEFTSSKKTVTGLVIEHSGKKTETVKVNKDDVVIITNGSITESTTYGDNNHAAPISKEPGGSWALWEKMASKSKDFGNPSKFYKNLPEESWFVSATVTILDDKITPYIERISKRDPHSGKIVTGGIVSAIDSNWILSYTFHRQPHFKKQKNTELVGWIYGLLSNQKGDFIKKPIQECTGSEICQEWLYHIGVPEKDIPTLATKSCKTVPVYLPYVTSYFMVRNATDRPKVIPKGSTNLAFIGNFAETPTDTVFTTEYSVRTAMEAVYTLLDVNRKIPEPYASSYDIRLLLDALYSLTDKKTVDEMHLTLVEKFARRFMKKKVKGTFTEEVLKKAKLIK